MDLYYVGRTQKVGFFEFPLFSSIPSGIRGIITSVRRESYRSSGVSDKTHNPIAYEAIRTDRNRGANSVRMMIPLDEIW